MSGNQRPPRRRVTLGRFGVGTEAQGDSRIEDILQSIEDLRNIVAQQAQNQEAIITAAAVAATKAAVAAVLNVAAPAPKVGIAAHTSDEKACNEDVAISIPTAEDRNEKMRIYKQVKQFLKLKPPKFYGKGDPEAATSWLWSIDKVFSVMRCTDADKVVLAVYLLEDNASHWWEATKDIVFPIVVTPTWGAFVEAFNRKYFSNVVREQKMTEFLELRQNQLSVEEYEAKFTELLRYGKKIVEDPVDRAIRFRDGLKLDIKSQMAPWDNYDEVLSNALAIERNMAEIAAASELQFAASQEDCRHGKKPMSENWCSTSPDRRGNFGRSMSHPNNKCCQCGGHHRTSVCPWMTGACFGCGQKGHLLRDCPHRPVTPSSRDLFTAAHRPASEECIPRRHGATPGSRKRRAVIRAETQSWEE